MKTAKPLPRPATMRNLSGIERKFLDLARRHRADYLRLLRRLRRPTKSGRSALTIAACIIVGLLATTSTNTHAAESEPALFNQANAAQRDGRVGPAILGYERALFLAPHDSAVEQNLRIAREKAGLTAPAIPIWQRPAHWLGFNGLALLGSCALAMSGAAYFAPSLRRRTKRAMAAICGAIMLVAISSLALRWNELDRAVIQTSKTTVHIAPAASAQITFELQAGDLVTAQGEHGDFVFVRTRDQSAGWVKKSDLERVIPTVNLSPM